MKRHRQKILLALCLLFSFGPRAFFIPACKDYIPFLFHRPKLTELKLQTDRFKDGYIRGLEQAHKHLRLAHKLRTESIDPWKTHIEEFAALVKPHLDYVERGIRSQDSADKLERLAILEDFRAEAQSWIEKQEVSYRRWVNLNLRLSILATPKNKRARGNLLFIRTLCFRRLGHQRAVGVCLPITGDRNGQNLSLKCSTKFPEVIIAPQMDGLTGIMALTRMTARRVYLHALENKASHVPRIYATPIGYFCTIVDI